MSSGHAAPLGLNEADALDREIGARLRRARTERGLTQADLGRIVGVSFRQIHKYECGANRISASALILLERALDVSPGALFGDETARAATIDRSLLSADGARSLLQAVNQISPQDRRKVLDLARELAAPTR